MNRPLSYDKQTDEELVALCLKNQDLYLELMKRYEVRLTNFVRKLTNVSYDEIEDIVQEVFIKAYRNLNDFDRRLKFSSWIYRIARNESISHYRKGLARPQVVSVEDNDLFLNQIAISAEDLERDFEKKIQNARVARILDRLEDKYREVLILRFFEERDYREIADILKKPLGTIGTLISQAKKAFIKESQSGKHQSKNL